jgi:photosystem II stability/assembly factor-like uncharacterized protein
MKRCLPLMLGLLLLLSPAPVIGGGSLAGTQPWRPMPGPRGGSVAALALSPNYPADHAVFAGLRGQGVYRTDDSGDSWKCVSPDGWMVVALAISPDYTTDGTLFASTGLSTTGFHVYRSTDEGGTWQEVTPAWAAPPNAPLLAISSDFATDRTLYVLGGLHTYVSTDGGDTFVEVGGWFAAHDVRGLAFSPDYAADETLFALVHGVGLYKSTDGGATWNPTGLSGDLSAFAVSPDYASDETLIAASASDGQVSMSTDGGDTWAVLGVTLGTGGQHTLLFSPTFATDQVVLVASSADHGPYRSADGGATWSPVGWYDPANPYQGGIVGGAVFALALAPATAYDGTAFAGTSCGIYRSSDRGVHWYQRTSNPAPLTVRALAVAPGDPPTLLAGTSFFETRIDGAPDEHDGNLQLSTNGGQTWQVVSGRLARVHSVAFSPDYAADETAFAATGTPGEHGLSDGGVYRSTDAGLNWTQVLSGSLYATLALSPDFAHDETLWVSAFSGGLGVGIYVSTNGGDTWTLLPVWVPARVLVPSPNYAIDQTLFAGTQGGLWKSVDGGASWSHVLSSPITALAVSPAYGASRTLYAGVKPGGSTPGAIYRSTNGGTTWQQLETGIPATWEGHPATISALAFAVDGSVLAGVYYGDEAGGGAVYRSVDGGESWQAVGDGLSAHSVFALATVPGGSLAFYAGTGGGLWRIEVPQGGPGERGAWVSGGPRGGRAQALAVSPDFASDGVAFAGRWLFGKGGGQSGPGILKSTDGGQTWNPSASGTEGVSYSSAVHAYAFSPDFAADRTVFAGTWGGLFKSTDGGESWQRLTRVYFGPPGSITAVAVAPDFASSGHVLAGSGWGAFYLSQDGGLNWTANYSVSAQSAIVYSSDFVTDGVAFAGGWNGLYKTTDRGVSWTQALTQPVGALAVSPQFGVDGTLFAGGDGLYTSTDGGTTWISTTVGSDASSVRALAISPAFASDRTLFAGTGSGLYRSSDGGASWETAAGFPDRAVLSLAISPGWPGHPVLLVGTDVGVYRTTDGGATWTLGQGLATLDTGPIAFSPEADLLLTGARNHGVYGSTNGGASWLPMGLQGGGWYYNIPDVAISPDYAADETLFAAWGSGVSIGGAVYRTTDRGATWELVYSTDHIGGLAVSPQYAADQTVYAVGNTVRVVRSTDGGETWDAVGTWPSGVYPGTTQVALPTNYPTDTTVFAAGQGFWRLPSGATEWALASGLDDGYYVRSIAISPGYAADQTLLATAWWFAGPAGPQRHAVFRSTDGGAHWELASVGLPETAEMQSVAFSPDYATDRIAYATSSRQLYRSRDGGQSWTALGGPPGSPTLYDVVVNAAGHVYVTSSAGVWHYATLFQDIIVDGGFEGDGGWDMPTTPQPAGYSPEVTYDGFRSARVGIVNDSNTYAFSSARQEVTIPVDAVAATLGCHLYPVSGESMAVPQSQAFRRGVALDAWHSLSSASAGDAQYVLVLDSDDTILEFLFWDLSNDQHWQRHTFDLTNYAGQTIKLHFGVRNDGQDGQTGMYVDNVSLIIERPGIERVYLPLVVGNDP